MDRTTYVREKGAHLRIQERMQEAEQWRLAETARGLKRQKVASQRFGAALGRSWALLRHVAWPTRA